MIHLSGIAQLRARTLAAGFAINAGCVEDGLALAEEDGGSRGS